jgi:glycosyltransferase involved in cell wall biosynthesis
MNDKKLDGQLANHFSSKRVLVITSDVPFVEGGHRVIARALCKALQNAGHQSEVWTTPQNRFGHQLKAYLATWLMDISESGDGLPVDHVISLRFPSYAVRHNRHSCWLNHRMREYYDLWESYSKKLYKRQFIKESIRRKLIFTADKFLLGPKRIRLFAQSKNIQGRLSRFGDHDSELLYPPPPERNYHEGPFPKTILSVGRLHPLKRPELLIRSFALMDKSWKLVIAGRGQEAVELKELAQSLGVAGRIDWKHEADDEELCGLYANCRAVFYGPVDEDYGMVPVEAYASGKPVITCFDSGGAKEWVEGDVCGSIAEPDPKAVAEALELYANEETARKFGEVGRERVSKITWDSIIKKLLWEDGYHRPL